MKPNNLIIIHMIYLMKNKIFPIFKNIEEYILVIGMANLLLMLFIQILTRYILFSPFFFTEEISLITFNWMVFIGASYSVKIGNQIKVSIFENIFNSKTHYVLEIFIQMISLLVIIIIVISSYEFINFNKYSRTPALRLNILFINLSVLVGFFLTALRKIFRTYRLLKNFNYNG